MQNFCYKCGLQSDKKQNFIENLCIKCYVELHPLLNFPHPLEIRLCKKCYRYNVKNRWISAPENEILSIIEHAIQQVIPLQIQVLPGTDISITPRIEGDIEEILKKNEISSDIQATGHAHISLNEYSENYRERRIKLAFVTCPSCLSYKRGDYKAVLHILTPKREILEWERDNVFSIIEDELEKSRMIDMNSYITKYTVKKGKLTFYLGSEKLARSLASIISSNLGGVVKETYTGAKRISKEIRQNKLFVSVYLSIFIEGDLLELDNTLIYVTHIRGNSLQGVNLQTNHPIKKPLKLLKKVKILRHASDLQSFIYFSQTKETMQLMDLNDYNIYEIPQAEINSEVEIGSIIKGFEIDGKIYLVS